MERKSVCHRTPRSKNQDTSHPDLTKTSRLLPTLVPREELPTVGWETTLDGRWTPHKITESQSGSISPF